MSMDEKQTILIVDDSLLICEQIKEGGEYHNL